MNNWPGRGLHVRMRDRIEEALGGRSWTWLADQIDVPQSTLSGQASKPRFSLNVAWRISRVLGVDLSDLIDDRDRETDSG